MTNGWTDVGNADVVLVMGGNPAENHPVGFRFVMEAKRNRKAKLVTVDPRFNRTAAVSDLYVPIRAGTDIAFLGGVVNYLLGSDKIHHDYVKHYTNAGFLIDEGFRFEDGLFSGYNAEKRNYGKDTWKYQLDKDGYVKVDETLQSPNCVFQLMKQHFSRYTPEMVSKVSGTPKDQFLKVCEYIAETAAPNKTMTILYALGWTQHTVGSQNIRTMAMIQLLLGNMGMAGGGINALRGHANVQGITDMCLFGANLPGYLGAPTDADVDLKTYLEKRTPKPLRPGQMNFPQNFPKWFTSLQKAWYGNAATKENNFCYDWQPKIGGAQDTLALFERMHQGKMTGFFCQGFNPLASVSNKKKVGDALAKLKYLVVIDPLMTDTSEFWKNHGELNPVDASKIQTEVFMLPSGTFAEEDGTFTNSSRNIIWKWKGPDIPGEGRRDIDIVADLFNRLRKLYEKDPEGLADFAVDHYVALVMLGQQDTARTLGERLLNVDFAGSPSGLNALAWFIVEPGGVVPAARMDLDLALRAAVRANDLTGGKDPWILDTLARVQFVRGQLTEALRQQLKAVSAAEKETGPRAKYLRRDLAQRLAEYQAAAEASEAAEQHHGQIP